MDHSNQKIVEEIRKFAREGRVWPTGARIAAESADMIYSQTLSHNQSGTETEHKKKQLPDDWHPEIASEYVLKSTALEQAIFDYDTEADGPNLTLSIENVRIEGPVKFLGSKLQRPLKFQNCIFEEEVVFRDCSLFLLSFKGCRFKFLSLSGSEVEKNFVVEQSVISNRLNARGASVGGILSLEGSTILSDNTDLRPAIDISKAFIASDLAMRNGFACDGGIDISDSRIQGNLLLGGAYISPKVGGGMLHGMSIAARNINVRGSVLIINGFLSTGMLDFSQGIIGSQFIIRSASLEATPGQIGKRPQFALDLSNVRIAQDLTIISLNRLVGDINLQGTAARGFIDNPSEWVQKKSTLHGSLWLNGFVYGSISAHSWRNSSIRRSWLRKVLPKHYLKPNFIRQPWAQLAAAHKQLGDYDAADDILAEAEAHRLRQSITRSVSSVVGILALPFSLLFYSYMLFTKFGFGFGYLRSLYLLLILWLAGVVVFSHAAENGRMKPVEEEILIYLEGTADDTIPEWYMNYNSFYYSADVLIPISLGQESKWAPMIGSERRMDINYNDPANFLVMRLFRNPLFSFFSEDKYNSFLKSWNSFSQVVGWLIFIIIGASFAGGFRRGGRSKE